MHLRNAQIFCDAASLRSISRAAELHALSQSSASQAISQLERDLAVQLIDRSRRPLELTPAGQRCYDGFRELLDMYGRIRDEVQGLNDVVAGRIRVAAIYSVSLMHLDSCVREFEQAWPQTTVQVDYLHPDTVYQRISDDEADLGLVSFPHSGGDFTSIPWREHPLVVVVAPGHPLTGFATSVEPQHLHQQDFVSFTTELAIRRKIDRWLKQAGVAVNPVREFDNIENIKRNVEEGTGVSLLPRPAVEREVCSGSLVALPVASVEWSRPLGIVHRRHRSLSRAARQFVEFLQAFAEEDSPATGDVVPKPQAASPPGIPSRIDEPSLGGPHTSVTARSPRGAKP